uniref:Kazal-like domain-containing protein n=1 Tax=Romanomermis culicivorax TaxID=13658 RepID=A0A915JHU9_ROMCU
MIMCAFEIKKILASLLAILYNFPSVAGQTCSIGDLKNLKSCAQPITDMLNSLTMKWPLPTPVPPINVTWIDKFCNNYANFAICLKPKNATCFNADQIFSVVSTAGYFCERQSFFYSKSSCLTSMIQSPSVQMKRCSLLAQDLLYHNVINNNYQKCNSIADALSCSYPAVQAICGRDVAAAVQEFGRRNLNTMYTDCQIESCVNGTYCMYGETCKSSRSCQCTIICPDQVETVCANDGATYSNECEMRNQMCLRKIWLLRRPMVYCDIQKRFPECDDSNIDNLTHCILPLYNGMISSFQQLDSYLSNFQSFMVNRTCDIFWTYKRCARSYSKNCANPNSDVLQELYDKYVCTDQGFTDLTSNNQCWSEVGQDGQFVKCSKNFGFAIDDLKFYSKAQYVNSFTDDMGRVCTALKALGTCVMPRVQALCKQKAVSVFQKLFLTYKMFMTNCNNTCRAIFSDTYGTINSEDWKTMMDRCVFNINIPVDGNVNLAIKVIDPFDCSTDNPPFIFIYSGSFENPKNLIAT